MKNIIKTASYSLVALSSTAYTSAVDYGVNQVKQDFGNGQSGGDIKGTFSNILTYLLGFLSLVAVAFAIYGGFQILTAGGDEEKVKKGKTTLINALIGIFVIIISWSLVSWLLEGSNDIVNTGT